MNDKSVQFEKELRAYFDPETLSDYDYKRVIEMFKRYNTQEIIIQKEIIYKKIEPKVIRRICPECSSVSTREEVPVHIDLDMIELVVCAFLQLTPDEVRSENQHREFVRARQYIYYLARKYTPSTCKSLGLRYGNRDHTTVISAVKKIKGYLDHDGEVISSIAAIEDYLVEKGKEFRAKENIEQNKSLAN